MSANAFYLEAAEYLGKALENRTTLKTLILSSSNVGNKRKTYAIVSETLKYLEIIDKVLEKVKSEEWLEIDENLLRIVTHDLIISKQKVGGGKLLKPIAKYTQELRNALEQELQERGVEDVEELLPERMRRDMQPYKYIRINLVQVDMNQALDYLKESFPLLDKPGEDGFSLDEHVPELLVFPPNTDLHEDDWYEEGKMIIQDKASCLPPHLLNPPKNSTVLDACSAPGNKTTFLAARQPDCKVYAVEKDDKRVKLLKKMVVKSKCKNITVLHHDFLTIDVEKSPFNGVTHILLDPSCSGSGMVQHHHSSQSMDKDRITKLAKFQLNALKHAMSFPRVYKISYSTCSIYDEENEEVVLEALEYSKQQGLGWKLSHALPEWKTRGKGTLGKHMLRTNPATDRCIGFFVAILERPIPDLPEIPVEDVVQPREYGEPPLKKQKKEKKPFKPVARKGKPIPITQR